MSLCAKQNTEAIFFRIFLDRANKGDDVYYNIVKPLILDAAEYVNKTKTICELDRVGLAEKLWMIQYWPSLKKVTPGNILLSELIEFIDANQEDYYGQ